MEFHISRFLRQKLELNDRFSYTGKGVFGDLAAARKLAKRWNDAHREQGETQRQTQTPYFKPVNAGALFAAGLLGDFNHAMVTRYREEVDPAVLSDALLWFADRDQPSDFDRLLLTFAELFPSIAIYRGKLSAAQWLAGTTDGRSNREAAFEELLMLWLTKNNSAFAPLHQLFQAADLLQQPAYQSLTSGFPAYFATRPLFAPGAGNLLETLRAPALASPDSLAGQLDFIREHWAKYLDHNLSQVLLAIDIMREEELALWMLFHPPAPAGSRESQQHRWQSQGFIGDDYVGFDGDWVVGPDGQRRLRRYAADHQAPLNEYEAFSPDQAWMPTVVMMAKSTYVWLEQLSRKYGRHIQRLDEIPDEELRLLAGRGMTALWLIGLWERSTASKTIKRLRGQSDAVASAYSLKEYRIAEDLGGNSGYETLRNKAAAFGIRLASDMVPNHMGIDSTWLVEHPEWFISREDSPFPVYTFEGPDLSNDSRVEIKIEDHYYDQTDAAVTFRLRQRHDGSARFVYHGNDGTTFAWNDTAQLDYSQAAVREKVMQTILEVARLFPIIRFDAAMTLAKRHVQRLWFPLPGVGGSIPSRAESAMSQEQFEALMPNEFWREVVDRVAVEVPGTLLLAEAFWLLEGYFVRTLGMHRVYNSAFMNMLRDEENAKYRSYLKKTIEFDPDILKRYVNFMSNPDERTAVDQFGTGDKYFGSCMLLATLPGLPMFAHGQIEGFAERYGMDFKHPRLDERANDGLIARYEREIAPLLKNRRLFAESTDFVLYDFWNDGGNVDENVFAYSNRFGGERALMLYNNCYESTSGTIHLSAASMDKGSGTLIQRTVTQGLGLPSDDSVILCYRDTVRDLEYLRRATNIRNEGMRFELRGYESLVLQHWRKLRSSAEQPWDRLCDALNGVGVHNAEEALSKLRLRPLHQALRHAVSPSNVETLDQLARDLASGKSQAAATKGLTATSTSKDGVDPRLHRFVEQSGFFYTQLRESLHSGKRSSERADQSANAASAENAPASSGSAAVEPFRPEEDIYKDSCEKKARAALHLHALLFGKSTASSEGSQVRPGRLWGMVLAWIVLSSLPEEADRVQHFDELQLRSALAEIFQTVGFEGEGTWRAAAQMRTILAFVAKGAADATQSAAFWNDPDVRWLTGVNESEGVVYFNKEAFEELLDSFELTALIDTREANATTLKSEVRHLEASTAKMRQAARSAGYRLDRYLDFFTSTPSSSEPVSAKPATHKPARLKSAPPKSATATLTIAASATPTPVTPKPTNLKPATPKPATPASAAPKPATPKPVKLKPASPKLATPQPATPEPATLKPAAPKPTTPKLATPTSVTLPAAKSTRSTPPQLIPPPVTPKPIALKPGPSKPVAPKLSTPTPAMMLNTKPVRNIKLDDVQAPAPDVLGATSTSAIAPSTIKPTLRPKKST